MKTNKTVEEYIKRIERNIQVLKNCCVQEWATKEEKEHWYKSIFEYEKELIILQNLTHPQ